MLQRLFDATAGKFSLISFGDADCPVQCLAAVPSEDAQRPQNRLPAAVGPGSHRAAIGRGFDRQSAALSCLGEAVELVSVCAWGDEPVVHACKGELDGAAVALDDLLLISDRQYAGRTDWNREFSGIVALPEPTQPDQPLDWSPARDLDTGNLCYVPAHFALIGYGGETSPTQAYAGNSAGCAAGSTLDAATLTAFLELVERDAAAIWWYGGHRRPAINLGGLPEVGDIARWIDGVGRQFQVLDITTDLAVPVCAAVSAMPDGTRVALGFAAHFNPVTAALSALTEMCQQVLAQDLFASQQHDIRRPDQWWRDTVTASAVPHIRGDGTIPLSDLPHDEAKPSLDRCLALCAAHRLRPLVIDLTRPSVGIPVVRVVVPGLRHNLPNFAPGRMYDVPRALGWQRQPTEDDMTAVPLVG